MTRTLAEMRYHRRLSLPLRAMKAAFGTFFSDTEPTFPDRVS